jgi:predicted O-methyltransferase YrrM
MPSPVIAISKPYTPELLPVVQMAIEGILENYTADVFEFGSGESTIWFADRANVVSVEHDPAWYAEVMKVLDDTGLDATVHLADDDCLADVILDYRDFDLVLIDCLNSQRMSAIRMAREHVRPGGWMVLDDSQWPILWNAADYLDGWQSSTVQGWHTRKSGERRRHQTTFYKRPING